MSERGWVAPHLEAEFPGLGVTWVDVDCEVASRSPEPVRDRLRVLSDRFYGSHAVHMRERPIPWAYRVFFRHVGLDPDRTRTPVEQLALERLEEGAFRSRGLPADAISVAVAETGVAVRAFDAARVTGPLCIYDSGPGESLREDQGELRTGTLVLADEGGPLAPLFGDERAAAVVGEATSRVRLAAVRVDGVPEVVVEEALWQASSVLGAS